MQVFYRQNMFTVLRYLRKDVCNCLAQTKFKRLRFNGEQCLSTLQPFHKTPKEIKTDFSDTDPDQFGTLGKKHINELLEKLPEEYHDQISFDTVNEKGNRIIRNVDYYVKRIKELVDKRRILDAIEVLETKMLKDDRVKPNYYVYNLLIKGCGDVGYTQKAFNLYNQMKKRGIKLTAATYTSLFNACANSPFHGDGLKRAQHLRGIIKEVGYEPNLINYHAMIKAFARGNDTFTAFRIVDEMIEKRFSLNAETMAFLLQACISNKESGFRHALLVWRKMLQKKIRPTRYTYNLMLKCAIDCEIGNAVETRDIINRILDGDLQIKVPKSKTAPTERREISWLSKAPEQENTNNIDNVGSSELSGNKYNVESNLEHPDPQSALKADISSQSASDSDNFDSDQATEASNSIDDQQNSGDDVARIEEVYEKRENAGELQLIPPEILDRPNLLAKFPHMGNVIDVKDIKSPQDRLLLLGGFKAVLRQMDEDKVLPNIKTFGVLLELIPPTLSAEEALLKEMKSYKVEPNIDFWNMLIKKRSLRCDYENAREVLKLIQASYLNPDIVTFGVLAMACKTKSEALSLMRDVEQFGYQLNMEILGAMMKQACYHFSFSYIIFLMRYSLDNKMEPNDMFVHHLQKFKNHCKELKRKSRNQKTRNIVRTEFFREGHKMFNDYYEYWAEHAKLPYKPHPWAQFRKPKIPEPKKKNTQDDSESAYAVDSENSENDILNANDDTNNEIEEEESYLDDAYDDLNEKFKSESLVRKNFNTKNKMGFGNKGRPNYGSNRKRGNYMDRERETMRESIIPRSSAKRKVLKWNQTNMAT